MPRILCTALFTFALLARAQDYESAGLKALDAKDYAQAVVEFQKGVAASPGE